MGERDDPQLGRRAQTGRAARLMELLGLSEDELCRVLDVDPLSLLSGQLEHAAELPILLELLDEARQRAGAPLLRRWVCAAGPRGRPIDALLARDFAAFEDALEELQRRGFVLRGGGGPWQRRCATGCAFATASATCRARCSTPTTCPTSTTASPSCGARRSAAIARCS